MKKKKNWIQRFFSATPAEKKRIRNVALLLLAVVISIGKGAVGITTPQWYVDYSWYIYAVIVAVVVWAQGHAIEENGGVS